MKYIEVSCNTPVNTVPVIGVGRLVSTQYQNSLLSGSMLIYQSVLYFMYQLFAKLQYDVFDDILKYFKLNVQVGFRNVANILDDNGNSLQYANEVGIDQKPWPQNRSKQDGCPCPSLQTMPNRGLIWLIGGLSHYLQGFNHPRWCRILQPSTVGFGMV